MSISDIMIKGVYLLLSHGFPARISYSKAFLEFRFGDTLGVISVTCGKD